MIRLLYNLLFPFALLFFLPGYVAKMLRRGNYREKFGQRLGFYDPATRATLAAGHRTWLHAVSVGEVMIALKLAAKMKAHEPDLRIALTTTTTTGFALACRAGAGMDRGALHSARLLANHATRLRRSSGRAASCSSKRKSGRI